ncbi:EF-hand domain-containing protein (plasmid) [Azospirillum oryzae]|uniref:EF-hand domain-containing protein n=1 Tax=Azospirillum oryzae TaxID=286727 RepID=A0A6N1ASD9_9PROT|nr:EF-hand domain-containing protein [Azospirillum oryzae]KAA0587693.1 hypothetical protein FZ938_15880 [Azospirillum oryzae]QKS54490.1 EF-hand domain-containing protein [Azospirillum oryzae]GLR82599.1 hypothetical protein GCM10007856_52980 [Azospirillum oryzae]
MKRFLIAALCTGLLVGGSALAQTGPGPGMGQGMGGQGMGQGMGPGKGMGGTGAMHQQMFDQLDADKDGVISRKEFVDAPRGGPGSMTDVAKSRRGTRFDRFDKNKDGKLTPEEWGAWTPAKTK